MKQGIWGTGVIGICFCLMASPGAWGVGGSAEDDRSTSLRPAVRPVGVPEHFQESIFDLPGKNRFSVWVGPENGLATLIFSQGVSPEVKALLSENPGQWVVQGNKATCLTCVAVPRR